MKLQHQLIGGFGVLLALLLSISILSSYRFSTTLNGFVEYRSLALSSVTSGLIQSNILRARLDATKFIKNQSPQLKASIEENLQEALALIQDVESTIDDKAMQNDFSTIKAGIVKYQNAFEDIVKLIEKRQQIVKDILVVKSEIMINSATEIASSAYNDDDVEAAFLSGQL